MASLKEALDVMRKEMSAMEEAMAKERAEMEAAMKASGDERAGMLAGQLGDANEKVVELERKVEEVSRKHDASRQQESKHEAVLLRAHAAAEHARASHLEDLKESQRLEREVSRLEAALERQEADMLALANAGVGEADALLLAKLKEGSAKVRELERQAGEADAALEEELSLIHI